MVPILTQSEADLLLAMEKHRASDEAHDYPTGGRLTLPLQSPDKREQFLLDISRGRIQLLKGTYQTRARHVVVLARLDFGGPPHRNPDGEEVPPNHLHVYREGWGDKWATPLPDGWLFKTPDDPWELYQDFLKFCVITAPPTVRQGLFS
jgi:hypothetical protein